MLRSLGVLLEKGEAASGSMEAPLGKPKRFPQFDPQA